VGIDQYLHRVDAVVSPPAPHAEVEARVAVVGAGPQGLAAALHLLDRDPSLHRDLVVVDPAGRWLQAWDDRFARLEIEHLRSTSVAAW
jgi:cation diffusion facilitator CzcD-associated flavoprotein CzcO